MKSQLTLAPIFKCHIWFDLKAKRPPDTSRGRVDLAPDTTSLKLYSISELDSNATCRIVDVISNKDFPTCYSFAPIKIDECISLQYFNPLVTVLHLSPRSSWHIITSYHLSQWRVKGLFFQHFSLLIICFDSLTVCLCGEIYEKDNNFLF